MTPRRGRGIYLLPTLFTVGCLFCGFSSIVQSSRGLIVPAALLIVLATLLDGLDGRVARLTGTTSAFGLEFDSLADIVSFGLAPALLWYQWGLESRVGWLTAFLYVVCAAMRLARFNLSQAALGRRHFAGLPSPMAGSALAAIAFAFPRPERSALLSTALAIFMCGVALLMISHVRYRSFKEFDVRDRRSYFYVLPMAAILVGIGLHPELALLLVFTAYMVSGPVVLLWSWARRGRVLLPTDAETVGRTGAVADEAAPR